MSFRNFDEHHKPQRGLAIRITNHALGIAAMAVATWLGNRREKKKQAIQDARDKARR